MKKIAFSIVVAAMGITGVQAQENKTVKQEATVKRVVTKEGSKVNIKEVKSTDTERGAVIVEGSNKTNQPYNENSKTDLENEILKDEVKIDKNNENLKREIADRQKAELTASKKRQLELAAQRKKELQEKEVEMQKELAERNARLKARPKGMSKLKQ